MKGGYGDEPVRTVGLKRAEQEGRVTKICIVFREWLMGY
jgi:hypothetical protein